MSTRSFGPMVVRRRLGSELRRLREEANLRLDAVAKEMEWSASKISRMENGQSIPKIWDVKNLLTLYQAPERLREKLLRWAGQGKPQGWWNPYVDAIPAAEYYISLEAEAVAMDTYCTPFVNTLLQTPDYARAVLSGILPELSDQQLEQLVEVRLRRQEGVHRADDPVQLRAVLDEADLHRVIGSPAIMRNQLAALLDQPDAVKVRVYRLTSGAHQALVSPFTIFTPRIGDLDPVVVNVESTRHDAYFEEPNEIQRFQRIFEDLWRRAADEAHSRDLIRSLLT